MSPIYGLERTLEIYAHCKAVGQKGLEMVQLFIEGFLPVSRINVMILMVEFMTVALLYFYMHGNQKKKTI